MSVLGFADSRTQKCLSSPMNILQRGHHVTPSAISVEFPQLSRSRVGSSMSFGILVAFTSRWEVSELYASFGPRSCFQRKHILFTKSKFRSVYIKSNAICGFPSLYWMTLPRHLVPRFYIAPFKGRGDLKFGLGFLPLPSRSFYFPRLNHRHPLL